VKPVLQKLKTDSDFDVQYYAVESLEGNRYTHTTILRPFFQYYLGEPVPEENFLWTMVQGKTT